MPVPVFLLFSCCFLCFPLFSLFPAVFSVSRCFRYLLSSAKGMLRGMWVFGVMDQAGEPLAWVGRDLAFEKKREAWEKAGRSGESPAKYRFPSKNYFRRKFELYGQQH